MREWRDSLSAGTLPTLNLEVGIFLFLQTYLSCNKKGCYGSYFRSQLNVPEKIPPTAVQCYLSVGQRFINVCKDIICVCMHNFVALKGDKGRQNKTIALNVSYVPKG